MKNFLPCVSLVFTALVTSACDGGHVMPISTDGDAGATMGDSSAPDTHDSGSTTPGNNVGDPCGTDGAFFASDCQPGCRHGAVHLECIAAVWTCVVLHPEACMPATDAGVPDTHPDASAPDTSDAGTPDVATDAGTTDTAHDSGADTGSDTSAPITVVVDDPAARLVIATQCFSGTVTVQEISPTPTMYATSVVAGGTETVIAPRFNAADGRMRLQIYVGGLPQAIISGGECASRLRSWQVDIFDRATGRVLDWGQFYAETVDGVCAYTLARAYSVSPYYTLSDYRSEARWYCPAPTPTPTTDAGTDAGSDAGTDSGTCTMERRYADHDGDGHGNPTDYVTVCVSAPVDPSHTLAWIAGHDNDCNDLNASVHPGATDICGNAADEDCNGTDAACPTPTPTDRIVYRWRINQTGTDPVTGAAFDWGTMTNQHLADQYWGPVTCLNTGSTIPEALGMGWYRCIVAARLTPFVGQFDSSTRGAGLGTAMLGSSCRVTPGVEWSVSYETSGAVIATTATLGMTTVSGQCRHSLP